MELDEMLTKLGRDARYGEDEADRLSVQLALEPTPLQARRARSRRGYAVLTVIATISGAAVGGMLEVGQRPQVTAMMPAGTTGTPADLLFGRES